MSSDQSKPSSTTEQSQPPAIAAYPTGHYAGSPYPPPTGPYPFYYPPHPEANGGDPNAPNGLPPTAYMMPFPHPGLVYAYPPPPPPPAGYAFPPPTAPAATAKPKRKQVKMACTNCAAACKRCDEARPCERCQKYGIAESCVDGVRKERKKGIKRGPYKRKNKSASTENAPYSGYSPSGEGQWPPPGEQANGGVPNGHPTMPPQFIPAPEGYYPYYYPPPPGYAPPPPHDAHANGSGSPNGQPPPPHHPYYPLHPAYPPIPMYPPGSYVPMPGQAPPGQTQSGESAEGKNGLPGGAGAETGAGEAKKKKRGRANRRNVEQVARDALARVLLTHAPSRARARSAVPATRAFSVSASRFGQTDQALSAQLAQELEYEKGSAQPEDPPFLKEFKDQHAWEIMDVAGNDEVVFNRKFGKENIRLIFSIADIQNPEESAFPESAAEDSEGAEDEEPSYPLRVSFTITKASVLPDDASGALAIDATAQEGTFVLDNISYYRDSKIANELTADADWKRRGLYIGPSFDTLDIALQDEFEKFLQERGINESLALFIPEYAEYKEQKEYTKWLEGVKSFIEA
ncbi:hypothetical protein EWM64_g1565 [Hericium alpestre]|uniref:Zn(2)-C6 fungal-type domain-containing protein n=1 Tax=Hericium alpestre TaxID=135208 RepID=A0A4Z0A5X5_9AGAM|nr:hypothetical protein EWM64_g1565 [Hericium alpestre]